MLRIGRCAAGEIDDVVRFIEQHWKPGHILTTCRSVLDWQYRDADGQGYAFILARRSSDQSLLGILGYIETNRFDPSNDGANVIWLTTWKVRDDAGVSGLGIQLLQYLTQIQPHRAIGAIGLTPSTLPLYRAFGYTVGELQHYVRPNPSTDWFELASISFRSRPLERAAKGIGPTRLITDDDFNHVALSPPVASVPLKSVEYFRRRYAQHPVYRYVVEAVGGPGGAVGLLAARIVEQAGRRALRIVDFSGSIERWEQSGRSIGCSRNFTRNTRTSTTLAFLKRSSRRPAFRELTRTGLTLSPITSNRSSAGMCGCGMR
jgi:hypothetical protein